MRASTSRSVGGARSTTSGNVNSCSCTRYPAARMRSGDVASRGVVAGRSGKARAVVSVRDPLQLASRARARLPRASARRVGREPPPSRPPLRGEARERAFPGRWSASPRVGRRRGGRVRTLRLRGGFPAVVLAAVRGRRRPRTTSETRPRSPGRPVRCPSAFTHHSAVVSLGGSTVAVHLRPRRSPRLPRARSPRRRRGRSG